jgi:hypothetical protein
MNKSWAIVKLKKGKYKAVETYIGSETTEAIKLNGELYTIADDKEIADIAVKCLAIMDESG